MKKIFKIILVYLIIIVSINTIFWALVGIQFPIIDDVYNNGMIIKIPVINKAYIFAHGGHDTLLIPDPETGKFYKLEIHQTELNGEDVSTMTLIQDLQEQGYEKIWLSQCGTGLHDYIIKNFSNGEIIYWESFPGVSRNENEGITMPIFTGFGFIRISI